VRARLAFSNDASVVPIAWSPHTRTRTESHPLRAGIAAVRAELLTMPWHTTASFQSAAQVRVRASAGSALTRAQGKCLLKLHGVGDPSFGRGFGLSFGAMIHASRDLSHPYAQHVASRPRASSRTRSCAR
jgi:hypothetical protein